jgi:hypothetical protein
MNLDKQLEFVQSLKESLNNDFISKNNLEKELEKL